MMSRIRIKFHGNMLWLLATAVISVIEIYAAWGRGTTVSPAMTVRPNPLAVTQRIADMGTSSRPIGIIDGSDNNCGSAILVLGNLGMEPNVDLIVT
jgi:hypothetical protein